MPDDNGMDQASGWHLILVRLEGRVSDDVLYQCRVMLAEQRYDDIRAAAPRGGRRSGSPAFPGRGRFPG
jgi:hypothetical protein